jgi:hypothetical protein
LAPPPSPDKDEVAGCLGLLDRFLLFFSADDELGITTVCTGTAVGPELPAPLALLLDDPFRASMRLTHWYPGGTGISLDGSGSTGNAGCVT